jgi:hypothetical protein
LAHHFGYIGNQSSENSFMRTALSILSTWVLVYLLTATVNAAPSTVAAPAFEGTWRPDPQLPSATRKPETVQLAGGVYDCKACDPPYKIKADGRDQAVPGNPIYDTMSITALDPHTVKGTAKKNGTAVGEILITVSPDGASKSEKTTLTGMAPKPIEVTSRYRRVAEGAPGSHPVSGAWALIDTDVTNHAEDTTFKLDNGKLVMTDLMGGSFTAKLDGTAAPYNGNPQYNAVSLKLINSRTIEESDLKDGKVAQIRRWTLAADNNTVHARFDDTQGHVQQQDGHRVK